MSEKKDSQQSVFSVSSKDFEEKVLNASQKKLIVVDFWATWCNPCLILSPVLEKIASSMPNISVCKINVENESDIAARYGVRGLPTLVTFKEGRPGSVMVGSVPEDSLRKWIEEQL